jgi:hypothetical protein
MHFPKPDDIFFLFAYVKKSIMHRTSHHFRKNYLYNFFCKIRNKIEKKNKEINIFFYLYDYR